MSATNREYLLQSIADTRDTIRAVDVKLIGTLFLFAFPLTDVKLVVGSFLRLIDLLMPLGIVVSLVVGVSWLIGITASLLGLIAIENPAAAVTNDRQAKGTYFGNGLFMFNFWKSFFPKYKFEKKALSEWRKTVRHSKSEILTELAFEQMKLVFIRNLKMRRQRVAVTALTVYLIVTVLVMVTAVISHSHH